MTILERYLAYADAFEKTYADDDWSRLEAFFTPGAVYDGEPPARGRAAVLAKLKGGIDAFDRRMDTRTPGFGKPTVQGTTVSVTWKFAYTKKGLPELVLAGVETAEFEGDRIAKLGGTFAPESQKALEEWFAKHGAALQGG